MQRIKFFLGILVVLLIQFSACQKSDNSINPGNLNSPATGQWKITYFYDKQDLTSNFNNFTFEIKSDGSLAANNGSQTWSGTWLTNYDDSGNKFLIDFAETVPSSLSDIEEDWKIVSMTDTYMKFEHGSNGGGSTDVLEFKKN